MDALTRSCLICYQHELVETGGDMAAFHDAALRVDFLRSGSAPEPKIHAPRFTNPSTPISTIPFPASGRLTKESYRLIS